MESHPACNSPRRAGWSTHGFHVVNRQFCDYVFVSGPGSTTLPIEIYARLRRTISPTINAVATLIFAASVLVLGGALIAQAVGSRLAVRSDAVARKRGKLL